MSRRKRARFDRRVLLNPVAVALENAARLAARDRLALQGIVRNALEAYRTGQDCAAQWCVLADALNVAEGLAAAGICSDEASCERIAAGQRALSLAHRRHAERGSWTMYAAELRALDEAVWVGSVQLDHCSLGEYERAVEATRRRMQQARAGNAPAGAVVCMGALG